MPAILWDNDGVLVDTERLYYEATRDALAALGVAVDLAAFVQLSLREGRSVFDLAAERGIAADVIEASRAQRDAAYVARLEAGVVERPGARTCLEAFRDRARMGIVTGAKRLHFEAIHRHSGLVEHVEFVLTREDYVRAKPNPDAYQRALERLALPADECVVVEDTERGVRAAVAAGVRCFAVPHDLSRDGDFSAAEAVFDDLGALRAALEHWLG